MDLGFQITSLPKLLMTVLPEHVIYGSLNSSSSSRDTQWDPVSQDPVSCMLENHYKHSIIFTYIQQKSMKMGSSVCLLGFSFSLKKMKTLDSTGVLQCLLVKPGALFSSLQGAILLALGSRFLRLSNVKKGQRVLNANLSLEK